MAAINIGGSSMDASYRYKMPPLQVKIEGRGNGIKTIVVNLFDVAKALHIHPAYPLKYFGIELGAQTKYTKATERCIVNGAHGGQDLAKLLTKFIDQFILCPTCKLPELKMSVGKRDLKITCDACGYSGVLNTPHKLAGYIQKNPPSVLDAKEEGGDDTKVAGRKLTKEERKAARAAKKGTKGDDNDEEGELEDEFDNLEVAEEEEKDEGEQRHRKQKKSGKKKSKSKEAAAEDEDAESASETEEERAERKRRKAEKKAKKAAKEAAAANGKAEKEDEWHTDVSKEAVRLRKEEERASMKGKVVNGDAEAEDEPAAAPLQVKELSNGYVTANNQSKSDIEAANLLRTFLQQKRSTDQTVAELKRLSLARGYDDSQRFLCLFNAICTPAEPKKLPSAMEKHAPVMRKLVGDSTQQVTILLNSVEHFLGEAWNAAFLPVTPHVLKSLYEADVLTEQQLIDWYDMPSDNPLLSAKNVSDLVRMKANVFIEWLKTADESEGEEEDD